MLFVLPYTTKRIITKKKIHMKFCPNLAMKFALNSSSRAKELTKKER